MSFVDDDTITASGRPGEVKVVLVKAAMEFRDVLKDELHVGLSQDKLCTIGSDPNLVDALYHSLSPEIRGAPGRAAANLGIDFSPGGKRSMRKGGLIRTKTLETFTRQGTQVVHDSPWVGQT